MGKYLFKVSPKRYGVVLEEIRDGSEPQVRFYVMVAVSTMIASFGLITNSTAVIIGAMLVAPLMTPIFGIALALIRGNTVLFGRALQAEAVGVVAAILMGFVLGKLYPALVATPEMLARTEPQLFDLLVAVFSGFAGAYALLDEKISPALPGVAIATAIVPPLANTGLCYSTGAYVAGTGSFLLFFANFLSILLVASVTFWVFGMAGSIHDLSRKVIIKRFGLPVACFLFVAVFLTDALIEISRKYELNQTIDETLVEEMEKLPDINFVQKSFIEKDGAVYILADMNSSFIITPTQVSRMQNALEKKIGLPTEIIVRSNIAREISALGSDVRIKKRGIDGSFIAQATDPRIQKAKIADTVIRNYLSDYVGFDLAHVKVLDLHGRSTVVSTIFGVSTPGSVAIDEMENDLREKLQDNEVKLIVRFIETKLYDETGNIRLEFSGLSEMTKEQTVIVDKITDLIKKQFEVRPELQISGINRTLIDDMYYFLVDVKGLGMFSREQIDDMQNRIAKQTGAIVKLYVYFQSEMVVSTEGYQSYSTVSQQVFNKQKEDFKESAQEIIKAAKL